MSWFGGDSCSLGGLHGQAFMPLENCEKVRESSVSQMLRTDCCQLGRRAQNASCAKIVKSLIPTEQQRVKRNRALARLKPWGSLVADQVLVVVKEKQ